MAKRFPLIGDSRSKSLSTRRRTAAAGHVAYKRPAESRRKRAGGRISGVHQQLKGRERESPFVNVSEGAFGLSTRKRNKTLSGESVQIDQRATLFDRSSAKQ